MLVIPAIDLRAGRCVRLFQGDFGRETVYDDDPARVARHWASLGARWLHIVDLDGARAGHPMQLDLVARIAAAGVPVELGGGLRSLDDVRSTFDRGVGRVVLGTAAIENPELLEDAVQEFGDQRVVLGVDARDGLVAVRGWEQTSTIAAAEVIDRARTVGIRRVIYTDIERDGTLMSPNFDAIQMVASSGIQVIASGGVVNREHLMRLSEIEGVEAAIVGRALYAGTLVIRASDDWWVEPSTRGTGGRV
jgi:phosphoribosylformimino-5-aminoimidazole carboxamide ribotide isomerase